MLDDKEKARLHQQRVENQYEYHEFPKVLYRDRPKGYKAPNEGGWVPPDPFLTLIVDDAEAEAAAIDDGWRQTPTRAATNAA